MCVAKHVACTKGSKMAVFISAHYWFFCSHMAVHLPTSGPVLGRMETTSRTLPILTLRISAFRDLPAQPSLPEDCWVSFQVPLVLRKHIRGKRQ